VTHGYDDWYEEASPCSSESSRKSRSPSSGGSIVEWSVAPWRSMLMLIAILFAALAAAFVSGCGSSRTVFVPEESPMRTGPNSSMRVYHRVNGEWTLSNNRIAVPEGWYLVPPSYVGDKADE
jgi:hypothetical protein